MCFRVKFYNILYSVHLKQRFCADNGGGLKSDLPSDLIKHLCYRMVTAGLDITANTDIRVSIRWLLFKRLEHYCVYTVVMVRGSPRKGGARPVSCA